MSADRLHLGKKFGSKDLASRRHVARRKFLEQRDALQQRLYKSMTANKSVEERQMRVKVEKSDVEVQKGRLSRESAILETAFKSVPSAYERKQNVERRKEVKRLGISYLRRRSPRRRRHTLSGRTSSLPLQQVDGKPNLVDEPKSKHELSEREKNLAKFALRKMKGMAYLRRKKIPKSSRSEKPAKSIMSNQLVRSDAKIIATVLAQCSDKFKRGRLEGFVMRQIIEAACRAWRARGAFGNKTNENMDRLESQLGKSLDESSFDGVPVETLAMLLSAQGTYLFPAACIALDVVQEYSGPIVNTDALSLSNEKYDITHYNQGESHMVSAYFSTARVDGKLCSVSVDNLLRIIPMRHVGNGSPSSESQISMSSIGSVGILGSKCRCFTGTKKIDFEFNTRSQAIQFTQKLQSRIHACTSGSERSESSSLGFVLD